MEPLTFDVHRGVNKVVTITVRNVIENVGQGVAVNVSIWEELVPPDAGFANVTKTARARQIQQCDTYRNPATSPDFGGATIFPHDPETTQNALDFPMDRAMKSVTKGQVGSDGKTSILNGTLGFAVVGCVYYRSPFEPLSVPTHQTRFFYALGVQSKESFTVFIAPTGIAAQLKMISFGYRTAAD